MNTRGVLKFTRSNVNMINKRILSEFIAFAGAAIIMTAIISFLHGVVDVGSEQGSENKLLALETLMVTTLCVGFMAAEIVHGTIVLFRRNGGHKQGGFSAKNVLLLCFGMALSGGGYYVLFVNHPSFEKIPSVGVTKDVPMPPKRR